jgi:hypothetical protein
MGVAIKNSGPRFAKMQETFFRAEGAPYPKAMAWPVRDSGFELVLSTSDPTSSKICALMIEYSVACD